MLRNLYFTAVVSICITANSLTGQTFTKLLDFGVDIGYSPHAPLIQGLDGALYGTTPSGGASAAFTVISNSLINATVPEAAGSGIVQVQTPGGTLSSNVPFRVRP